MNRIVLILITISVLWFGNSHAQEPIKVPRFVMGVFLPGINDEIDITDIRVTMDFWMREISGDMNIFESRSEFFLDMADLTREFRKNQIDMIIAPPLSIAKHFKLSELSDGFVGVREHGLMNSLILLVKNDGAINNLADLKGKRLLMPENDELSEVYIDTMVRKLYRQGYANFFSSIAYEKKNSRLILDLFFGKADAALVYLRAYDVMIDLNPQIKADTKILFNYPLRAKNYCYFSRNFQYAETILNNVGSFTKNPRGREMLELFKTDEIVPAKVDELRPIMELYDEYLHLKIDHFR